MDKVIRVTESTNLVALTADEMMDVQGGNNENVFDIVKKILNELIKIENQP